MKPDKITKVYESLTSREKAKLAFKYFTEVNNIELSRIESTVPQYTYRCLDSEYRMTIDGLFHMALIWGLMYQENRIQLLCYLYDDRKLMTKNDVDKHDDCGSLEGSIPVIKVIALQRALEQVCDEQQIDQSLVYKMSGVTPINYSFEPVKIDEDCYATYLEKLRGCLG